ncbi:hypothetical protein [Planctomycetes bacterium K23_9]|uniref:hypothetical protein n=1 Tax=Stieleria marina TaxID=1930275 RepID=UPI00119D8A02
MTVFAGNAVPACSDGGDFNALIYVVDHLLFAPAKGRVKEIIVGTDEELWSGLIYTAKLSALH